MFGAPIVGPQTRPHTHTQGLIAVVRVKLRARPHQKWPLVPSLPAAHAPSRAFHAEPRPWQRTQPRLRNPLFAASTNPVLSRFDPPQRKLNFRKRPHFALHVRHRQIVRHAVQRLCALVVWLSLEHNLLAPPFNAPLQLISLGQQQLPEYIRAAPLLLFQRFHRIHLFSSLIHSRCLHRGPQGRQCRAAPNTQQSLPSCMLLLKEPYPLLLTCPAARRQDRDPTGIGCALCQNAPSATSPPAPDTSPSAGSRCRSILRVWRNRQVVQACGTTGLRKRGETREAICLQAWANARESRLAQPTNPLDPAAHRHTRTSASSSAASANKSPAQYPAAFLPRQTGRPAAVLRRALLRTPWPSRQCRPCRSGTSQFPA